MVTIINSVHSHNPLDFIFFPKRRIKKKCFQSRAQGFRINPQVLITKKSSPMFLLLPRTNFRLILCLKTKGRKKNRYHMKILPSGSIHIVSIVFVFPRQEECSFIQKQSILLSFSLCFSCSLSMLFTKKIKIQNICLHIYVFLVIWFLILEISKGNWHTQKDPGA